MRVAAAYPPTPMVLFAVRSASSGTLLRHPLLRYAVAVLSVGLGLGVRLLLQPLLGTGTFLVFIIGTILTSYVAGRGPAIFSSLLGVLAADYFFMAPPGFGFWRLENALWDLVFLAACAAIISIVEEQRTQQRRADAALIDSRNHADDLRCKQAVLNGIMTATDVLLVYLDRDFNFIAVNPAYARSGKMRAEEMIGKNHFALYPHEENEAIFRRVRDTGEPVFYKDKPFVFPDQPERGVTYWDWSLVPVKNNDGAVEGLVFSLRETTTYRRAEAALRESEEQFRNLFESMDEGFASCEIITDNSGQPIDFRYLAVNPAFAAQTGLPTDQVVGRTVREVLPAIESFWIETYGRIVRTGKSERIAYYVASLGKHFELFAWRSSPGRFAVVFNDVTERKKMEEALSASESRLRALLECAPQGVIACDEQGRVALMNAKTEELFGYTRDELVGRPLNVLLPERFHASHDKHVHEYFLTPHTRTMGLGLDLRGRRKDGSEFPIEVSLSSVDQCGHRLALALITDITERREADARLRETQKLESIGLLAGGIAHDFNNLLVGVIGHASLALDVLPAGSSAAGALQTVVRTGEQAAHLTRQLLAYAGKGQFVLEPVNLSELVPEMIGLVQPSISKKVAVHLEMSPDVPLVLADRGQVQQVVMNLILNAAEAIRDAGVIGVGTSAQEVTAEDSRRSAHVAELRPGKYVVLTVRDTGCGMSEATISRIFDPFFSTKFQGRGLGLAAVMGIVRGHKGAITVTSTPGQGTCFTVLFPAAEGVAVAPPVVARDATLHGTGTVLVVDDEESVRDLARQALERYGYKVLVADGGPAAIDVFKRYPGVVSLVLLDASMPAMSGPEVLPELRKIRPAVPVLVSSGYSETETMQAFQCNRGCAFIQKPYTITRLAEAVKAAIGYASRFSA